MESVKLLDKQTVWEQMEEEERNTIKDFDKYHDELWEKMMKDPEMALYVAEASDGRVVGMVWLGVRERISGAKFGWIYDVTVDREFRKRGLGTLLMQRAEEHLRAMGVLGIGLMALTGNEGARRLHRKVGFRDYSTYMIKKL